MTASNSLDCFLATKSLFIGSKENVCQCCMQGIVADAPQWNTVKNLNTWYQEHNTFNDIRRDLHNGLQNTHCKRCWSYEDNGLPSPRQHANLLGKGADNSVEIQHLDIRLSNKCNLRCRMCNAGASSLIEKVSNQMLGEGYTHNKYASKKYNSTSIEDIKSLVDLIVNCNTLKSIEFAGGEPFIMPEVEYLLQSLVTNNKTDLRISVITNVTTTKNNIFDLLKHFKKVSITCSIDSVDKYVEYQRYPVKWSTLESNFKYMYHSKTDTLNFTILPSISQLTLLGICDFVEYFSNFDVDIGFNQVVDPSYLDYRLIPLRFREKLFDQIKTLDYSFLNGYSFDAYKSFFEEGIFQYRKITTEEKHDLADAVEFWDYKSNLKYKDMFEWSKDFFEK